MASEPTLYRRVGEPARIKGRKKVGGYRYVPVERCEHTDDDYPNGHIDGHWTEYDPLSDRLKNGHWCPGAGIGGDEIAEASYLSGESGAQIGGNT